MITFDYAQMNKKGLKDVVKWLEKQALPVKEVRGSNAPKRENGFQVKSAEIEFESGQILLVKAKANVPAFFQVKLNNKVLAIRDYKQLDNELREIAAFVKENEPKYAKNQEKAAAKAKIKIDVPKPVVTTTAEQTEAFKASLAELQGQSEALGNQLTEVTAQVNQKTGQLADLQGLLASEKGITETLEAQIAEFSGSATTTPASNAPIQHVVTLVEAPRKMAMLETKMRYDVLLNGKFYSELYFNTKGYVGKLPLPSGKGLTIGEVGISAYKKEISRINKDAKAGIMESAGGATECPECDTAMTGSICFKCGLKRTVFEAAGTDSTEAQINENAVLFPGFKTNETLKVGDTAKAPCPHCHKNNVLIYKGDKTFKCKSCGMTSRNAVMEAAGTFSQVKEGQRFYFSNGYRKECSKTGHNTYVDEDGKKGTIEPDMMNQKVEDVRDEPVLESALPGYSKWDTFAGGTSAAAGKNSYSIRADGGGGPGGVVQYHVDPISNSSGRHQGYSLKAFGIPGEPGWRWIGPDGKLSANGQARLFSRPQEAVKVAQEVHEKYVENKGGN